MQSWFAIVLLLMSWSLGGQLANGQSTPTDADPMSPEALPAAVVDIFEAKCSQCHSPYSRNHKARNHWSGAANLSELISRYVEQGKSVPADATRTLLWEILTSSGKHLMPPAKAKAGPLSDAQLRTIRVWLEAGAPAGQVEAADDGHGHDHAGQSPAVGGPLGFAKRLLRWLGRLHVVFVHLPIGLILAAVLAEMLWWWTMRPWFDGASRYCVILGAVSAVSAAAMGWWAAWSEAVSSALTTHRWLGVATATTAMAACLLSELGRRHESACWRKLFQVLLIISGVLVAIAGYFGAVLVHGADHLAW